MNDQTHTNGNGEHTGISIAKAPTFRQELEAMGSQFQAALPAHIPLERFQRVVMTAAQNNDFLLRCDRKSLWSACIKAAQDGLLPDGREGAMVPRKAWKLSKRLGRDVYEVVWQPMIAGIRKKVRNSGEISVWDCHCVYSGDTFELQFGDEPSIKHTYDMSRPRGELIGVYSVAKMKDGSKSYEAMSVPEIIEIRDQTDGWRAWTERKVPTPWHTHFAEMARKTVARRHSKMLPMSSDLDDLMRRDEELYEFNQEGEKQKKDERPKGTIEQRFDKIAGPSTANGSPDEGGETIKGELRGGKLIERDGGIDRETGEVLDEGQRQEEAPATDERKPGRPRKYKTDANANQGAPEGQQQAIEPKPEKKPPQIKTASDYVAYATGWIGQITDAGEARKKWDSERNIRNSVQLSPEVRDALQASLTAMCNACKQNEGTKPPAIDDEAAIMIDAVESARREGSRAYHAGQPRELPKEYLGPTRMAEAQGWFSAYDSERANDITE